MEMEVINPAEKIQKLIEVAHGYPNWNNLENGNDDLGDLDVQSNDGDSESPGLSDGVGE